MQDTLSEFFTKTELEFFSEWRHKPYDPTSEIHVAAKNRLMETVWSKSVYLGHLILEKLEGLRLDGKRIWSQRGWREVDGENIPSAVIKPYTWVKIFRETDAGKDIFFTFGLDAHEEAFVYKIDCQFQRQNRLTNEQAERFKSIIPKDASWNEVSYKDLLNMNWQSLTKVCTDFINEYLPLYDDIIAAIWEQAPPTKNLKNALIKRDRPDGIESIPQRARSFAGIDVDFDKKAKAQKDLGDKGEDLVKLTEIKYLNSIHREANALKVKIAKDGEGYDVLSFDEEGNEKYIEVKTTTGEKELGFFLSANEFDFMRLHTPQYSIYRIFNYNEQNNNGEYFEIKGDVEDQLLLEPTQYKVFLKKEL